MKRSPLQRRTPLARAVYRRERRMAGNEDYQIARTARVALAGGWCEGFTPDCLPGTHRGVHAHHVRLRSQGGADTVDNLRLLCLPAHSWCHAHPAAAAKLGLIERNGG